jgi:hypothetical protein
MVGVGGTSPKTKAAKAVWWILFGIFAISVIYVLIKNRHDFLKSAKRSFTNFRNGSTATVHVITDHLRRFTAQNRALNLTG